MSEASPLLLWVLIALLAPRASVTHQEASVEAVQVRTPLRRPAAAFAPADDGSVTGVACSGERRLRCAVFQLARARKQPASL